VQVPAMLANLVLSKQAAKLSMTVSQLLRMECGTARRRIHDDLTIVMVYLPYDVMCGPSPPQRACSKGDHLLLKSVLMLNS
jgi:hypothetical protein